MPVPKNLTIPTQLSAWYSAMILFTDQYDISNALARVCYTTKSNKLYTLHSNIGHAELPGWVA